MLHLLFSRLALAHYRLFYLQSRVFMHRQAAHHQRRNRRAARLPQHQGGRRIHVHKHLLHRRHIRLILLDDFRNMLDNHTDAAGQLIVGQRFDATGSHINMLAPHHIDYTKAGYAAAGVDAEDTQGAGRIHPFKPFKQTFKSPAIIAQSRPFR